MIQLELSDEIIEMHRAFIKGKSGIKDRLEAIDKNTISSEEGNFIDYLIDQVVILDDDERFKESIFIKKPEELRAELDNIKRDYPEAYENCKAGEPIRKLILDSLGYNAFGKEKPNFRDKKDGVSGKIVKKPTTWSPYSFTYLMGLKVCPYCNRSYIHTYYNAKGKTRPDLDHFIPKSKFPYFSMSIYNLVPSCKICNSSLKGQKEFDFDNYMNPYEKSMGDKLMSFSYTPKVFPGLIGLKESDMEIVMDYEESNPEHLRLKKNCDVFKIEGLYQNHKNVVCDMLRKNYVHNSAYRDSLLSTFPNLFDSREEIDRFLLGVANKEDIRDTVLGKLKWDVYSELNEE